MTSVNVRATGGRCSTTSPMRVTCAGRICAGRTGRRRRSTLRARHRRPRPIEGSRPRRSTRRQTGPGGDVLLDEHVRGAADEGQRSTDQVRVVRRHTCRRRTDDLEPVSLGDLQPVVQVERHHLSVEEVVAVATSPRDAQAHGQLGRCETSSTRCSLAGESTPRGDVGSSARAVGAMPAASICSTVATPWSDPRSIFRR